VNVAFALALVAVATLAMIAGTWRIARLAPWQPSIDDG
jgi:hypothetical protein